MGANAAATDASRAMLQGIRAHGQELAARREVPPLSGAVLDALARVPRHRFVPADSRGAAYADHALPIGHGQTISQPYIVALMTELLGVGREATVLEVGTGSGYQSAVLAECVDRVISIERVPALADSARARLAALGYRNVEVLEGDGCEGVPARAPFDGIIVTAAAESVPPALVDQLGDGARLVIPVGFQYDAQWLSVVERTAHGRTRVRRVLPVLFVPLLPG